MPPPRLLLALAALTGLLVGPAGPARADDEAERPPAAAAAVRHAHPTVDPPNAIDTGGATILVNAPIDVVRKVVTDYAHYDRTLKPFEQSRVLSRKKGTSEVYLQLPILHGAARIWAVVLIPPPVKDGARETIAVRYDHGNLADFRATWQLRAVDAEHTEVSLDLLVDPSMPFSAALILQQLEFAADSGVTAVRDQAEAALHAAREAAVAAASARKAPAVAER